MDHVSFADVWQKRHEACSLDGVFHGALESSAITTAFAAKELALAGAKLLKTRHVLVIDESRPGTAFLGAETATVFPAAS
jgi:hypothetical protein